MRILKGLWILFLFTACGETETPVASSKRLIKAEPTPVIEQIERFKVQTEWDALRLRSAPGVNSEVIRQLPKSTALTYFGDISPFTTKISFNGVWYDQPWVKVETTDGELGWIYAAGLQQNQPALAKIIYQAQLVQLFGQALTDQFFAYQSQFEQDFFPSIYNQGIQIQTLVNNQLRKMAIPENTQGEVEPFWIGDVFPGFLISRRMNGNGYVLLQDYPAWMDQAKKVQDEKAQRFFELMYFLNPLDSIESTLGFDVIEVEGKGIFSTLQSSRHNEAFQRMSILHDQQSPYRELILNKKEAIIENLLRTDLQFWYPCKEVSVAIAEMLKKEYSILSAADLESLRVIKQRVDDGKVKCNVRAG